MAARASRLRGLLIDSRGANLVEYLIIVGFVLVLSAGAWHVFGSTVSSTAEREAACFRGESDDCQGHIGEATAPSLHASRTTPGSAPAALGAPPGAFNLLGNAMQAMLCTSLVCMTPPPEGGQQPAQAQPQQPIQDPMEAAIIRDRGQQFYRDHGAQPGQCRTCHQAPANGGGAGNQPAINEADVIRDRGQRFYRDHGAQPGSCPNCHGGGGGGGMRSRREWQDRVLADIGVTRRELEGYTRFNIPNQAIMRRIYDYYRGAFRRNPNLLWAGMAVLAGHAVWQGLADNVGLRPWSPSGHLNRIAEMLERELMQMNLAIFMDLGWQHEAYIQGGLAELEARFRAGEIDTPTIQAWRQIDRGIRNRNDADIQAGNQALLLREQSVILPPGYANIQRIPGINFGRTMGRLAQNPIPGGRRFEAIVPGGNLAVFEDRWRWIERDMVPHWNRMSPEDRLHYVNQPIDSPLSPPLRLDMFRPRQGGAGGGDRDLEELLRRIREKRR